MRHSRRHFLTGVASLALVHGHWADLVSGQPRKGARLILLGTKGGPRVGGQRRNPSTLILINDVPYVIDCGNGTSQQLLAAGVTLNRLRYVFLTHMHSDHMLEYGPLVYNAVPTAPMQQRPIRGAYVKSAPPPPGPPVRPATRHTVHDAYVLRRQLLLPPTVELSIFRSMGPGCSKTWDPREPSPHVTS